MKNEDRIYFQSRIIHADLWAARANLDETMDLAGNWLSFMKLGLIAVGNLADLDGPMRPLYPTHPEIAAGIKALRADLDFAKYLRNIFVGHLNEALLAKAYEWRPELREIPKKRELIASSVLNVYVLETAINTYVAPDGSHQFFPSETDLVYPPDRKRFVKWLLGALDAGIAIADALGSALHGGVEPLGESIALLDAFKAAGLTDFSRITKGR